MILTTIDMVLTTSNMILAILAILGVVFGIYSHFKKPQEDLEHKQIIADKDLGTKATILAQKELETKALLLAEQVKNKEVENERRFVEMGTRLDASMLLAANHIHTVDIKVDKLTCDVNTMCVKIQELTTIIDERIPRRNN